MGLNVHEEIRKKLKIVKMKPGCFGLSGDSKSTIAIGNWSEMINQTIVEMKIES